MNDYNPQQRVKLEVMPQHIRGIRSIFSVIPLSVNCTSLTSFKRSIKCVDLSAYLIAMSGRGFCILYRSVISAFNLAVLACLVH